MSLKFEIYFFWLQRQYKIKQSAYDSYGIKSRTHFPAKDMKSMMRTWCFYRSVSSRGHVDYRNDVIGQILCRLIMFTWDDSRIHTSKTDRVMKFYITVTLQQG